MQKSKRVFKSTAQRTHKKNVRRNMSRGGIRLWPKTKRKLL